MLSKQFLKEKIKKNNHAIPSREYILSYLNKKNSPVNKKKLANILGINQKEIKKFNRRLHAMEEDGELIFISNDGYILPKKTNFLIGKVIGHRDGYGFFRCNDFKEDFYISFKEMKICIHGDLILAKKIKKENNKKEIKVLKIVKERNNKIVGKYCFNSNVHYVIPNDSRLNFNIFLSKKPKNELKHGTIVLILLKKRPIFNKKALGIILKVLNTNNIYLAESIARYNHEIPYDWPKKIHSFLKNIKNTFVSEELEKGRIDLRHLPFITIDEENAKDFDDAVYCEKKNLGWKLWIAIADVSYYVQPDTLLDEEAMLRGTSVYFPSKVIPMLPEILSNNLCSLIPEEDRLCMICEIFINHSGLLMHYKHYEAVIRSHARLTYTVVSGIIKKDKILHNQYKFLINDIENLYNMYLILLKKRIQRGSITFEKNEVKFILNDAYRIQCIEKLEINDAHKLIEECMILANIASAHFIKKNKVPGLFRNHEKPTKKSINELRILLKELKLNLLGGHAPKPSDYSRLLLQTDQRIDRDIIQNILLRSMQRAIYSPDCSEHFGLSLKHYAHFTSPIRRYPDLILHRIIKNLLKKNMQRVTGAYAYKLHHMKKLGLHCSLTERRADDATRDVHDWMKCDFMLNKINKKFTGIIVNITNFGFFVRINNLLIDGLVHISTLNDDDYHFDTKKLRLVGESNKKFFSLGDLVNIKVQSVNIDERKINFALFND